MAHPLLGRTEEFMAKMSDKTRRKVLTEILRNVDEGVPLDSACWAADVNPGWLEDWMRDDARVRQAVMKHYAILERQLVRQARTGDKAAKAALEILERQFRTWAKKTSVTFAAQFDEALTELENKLPKEHFETVVSVLAKYS